MRHLQRSLVSLATVHMAAVAAAQAQAANSPSPDDYKIRINDHGGGSAGIQLKAKDDLNPISIRGGGGSNSLRLHDANDEKFGIPDSVGITQWPDTGKSVAYAGQQERHTPAWMASASRRPVQAAARA
jgi:hypothetical protein